MRDSDAEIWLNFEQRGHPDDFKAKDAGACRKYVYRFLPDRKVYTTSLPEFEARKKASEIVLTKIQVPAITETAENYLVAGATAKLVATATAQLTAAREAYVKASTMYARMRALLHRWASDTLIGLELGLAAEQIFDAARLQVDVFVGSCAPGAASQLAAVSERLLEGSEESVSQTLTSCRRLIISVADAVFPAQESHYQDAGGKRRLVGEEQYKNRLLAFLDREVSSHSTRDIAAAQLEHLAARLDAVYEKACKGVHAVVTAEEARLVVIETYVFLAEVARYASEAAR